MHKDELLPHPPFLCIEEPPLYEGELPLYRGELHEEEDLPLHMC